MRHKLATVQQNVGETIDEFILRIDQLCKDCNFTDVTAVEFRDQMKRGAFISGLASGFIRQCLHESKTLTFDQAFDQGGALDIAKRNAETYSRYFSQLIL